IFPTRCPDCQSVLQKDDGGVYVRCLNKNCSAQLKERIRFFAGRSAMNIDGLGEKLIETLVQNKLVQKIGDLYRIVTKKEEMCKFERMGVKKADNLIHQIEQSRNRPLAAQLAALSIRHVGTRTANLLAKHFGDIQKLRKATIDELSVIDEIGDVIARSLFDYFRSAEGIETIDDLISLGLFAMPLSSQNSSFLPLDQNAAQNENAATSDLFSLQLLDKNSQIAESRFAHWDESKLPISGQMIVVTGMFQNFKRAEIESFIDQRGGRTSSSVSAKTSYLLAGDKPGSKLAKAAALGIRIVSESEFDECVNPK
ncbi:MAG: helix-hairpin-helix domain-containing protein, partial [Thermoguttaceae bacterium]